MDVITDLVDMSLSNFWEIVQDREAWLAAVHGFEKSEARLSNWTTKGRVRSYEWTLLVIYFLHSSVNLVQ